MPPDVVAPDPVSADPIVTVIVVVVGTVATMKFVSSKSLELKLELVAELKLSQRIISY